MFALLAQGLSAQPELFSAIGERLSYMQDVALYKSLNGLPVDDPAREALVLDRALDDARYAGLDPVTVEAFFEAQIALAKVIQYRYLADLQTHEADRAAVDLPSVVRPKLIALGALIIDRIADSLAASGPITDSQFDAFVEELDLDYLTAREQRLLFDALKQVRLNSQFDAP